jgi:hypothetical protein
MLPRRGTYKFYNHLPFLRKIVHFALMCPPYFAFLLHTFLCQIGFKRADNVSLLCSITKSCHRQIMDQTFHSPLSRTPVPASDRGGNALSVSHLEMSLRNQYLRASTFEYMHTESQYSKKNCSLSPHTEHQIKF